MVGSILGGVAGALLFRTINAIERERYDPSLGLAFKLAAQFDCTVEDLFDPAIDEPA